ncbi:MAG: hypothetical protein KF861_00845 [Planctomycetaceae bacterium]|nr:hypothetical protein [Planctomycetaceae bacterium]
MAVRIWSLAGLFVLFTVPQAGFAEGIFSRGTPDAGTPEYYQFHCNSPVGSRQVCCKGKLWPPRPRPTGPHQPCAHKYHAATYWPWPYVCQDRMLVNSTAYTQVENGWITATTFYDYHFDPETQSLNSAGRRHLQWLVTFVPDEYRRAYVSSTFSEKSTDIRVASVETEMAGLLGAGQTLPIELRVTQPLQRSATVVEQITRSGYENLPIPQIEYQAVSAQ